MGLKYIPPNQNDRTNLTVQGQTDTRARQRDSSIA